MHIRPTTTAKYSGRSQGVYLVCDCTIFSGGRLLEFAKQVGERLGRHGAPARRGHLRKRLEHHRPGRGVVELQVLKVDR